MRCLLAYFECFNCLQIKFHRLDSDIDFSSPISWADEVEKEEKLVYTENARMKYKLEQRYALV